MCIKKALSSTNNVYSTKKTSPNIDTIHIYCQEKKNILTYPSMRSKINCIHPCSQ